MPNTIINDVRIQQRYDTEVNWTNNNPVLLKGELAFTNDRGFKYKIGNGTDNWKALQYNAAHTLYGLNATIAELNYVHGVKSDIQNQINGKAPLSHTHNYLPLSGGTLNISAYYGLILKRTDTNGAAISFQNTTKVLGGAGFLSNGNFQISSESNTNGNIFMASTTGATFPGTVTASTFIGSLTGTANIATKLGTVTVGGSAKPIYLNNGIPTALSASIGAANKPIFINAGTLTASNATVGSSTVPVFMNAGAITACTGLSLNTTGSAAKWTNARTITLTGAINGSVSIDGSGNVSLATLEGNLSFKRKGEVSATTDWNTLMDPGCYKVQMASWGDKTKYHSPNEYAAVYSYGLLLVFESAVENENRTIQIYLPHSSANSTLGLVMIRMYNSTAWNTWQPIFKGVTKSYIGLGNVDNTSDSNKSVASATKWTTSRTLTIGNTGKLVNGLSNVTWSLAEIGAAPATGSTSISKLAATITLGDGNDATIYQNGATYHQKFEILDNSTVGDAVFKFSQSTNGGSSFISLLTINDDGNIIANKFTGSLVGNATTASSASKWTTARTITLTGSVTGSTSIDGSGNVSIATTTNHSHSYLPLSGGTMSGTITSSKSSSTYLAGNQGVCIINSTASDGSYTMLAKLNSTNGYFTTGAYQGNYLLQYTTKATVTAGTNSINKSVTLLNESGNSSFPGTVTAPSFSGSLSGTASQANKWTTARSITLTGSVTGTVNIDGSGNVTLATTTNHSHSYLPLSGGLMSVNSTIRFRSSAPDGGRAMGLAYMDSADNSKTVAGIGALYSKDIISGVYMGVSSEPWGVANGLFVTSDLIRFKNNTIWHAGNDGSGSGLDADLLDGKQASAFANVSHTHNYAGSTSAGGAANSLTYFKNTSTANVGVDTTDANAIGYVSGISLLGQKDGGLIKQVYSSVWMGEIYIDYRTGQLCSRGKNNGTLQAWRTQIDSGNYTSYCPTKTGAGASGTWGISITGNAATATKATQDGSGNTITTKYVTVDTGQTISGVKTFSSEQRFSAQNGFRLINGNYGTIFRKDNSDFYILLTDSGNATTGNYNTLRPFRIVLSSGEVFLGNGMTSSGVSKFTSTVDATSASSGAVIVSGGLGVAKQIITNSGLYVGHANAANAIIYLNSKRTIAGTDAWLRINDTKAFTSGVYFGSSLIRTDGSFQVGASGSSVNITTSVIQLKTPTTISNAATITGVTSITNTTASTSKTTGALKVSGGVGVTGKINAQSLGINDTWTIQLGSTGSIDFILN